MYRYLGTGIYRYRTLITVGRYLRTVPGTVPRYRYLYRYSGSKFGNSVTEINLQLKISTCLHLRYLPRYRTRTVPVGTVPVGR